MIIGTFNTDKTDPQKAVPSLETSWSPETEWNLVDNPVTVKGRYLLPGEELKYVAVGGDAAAKTDYRGLFSATVTDIENVEWKDTDGGTHAVRTASEFMKLGRTDATTDILYGWCNHILTQQHLTEDEVKN